MRFQTGDKIHVVLCQHFQQRVERLTKLRVILHNKEDVLSVANIRNLLLM